MAPIIPCSACGRPWPWSTRFAGQSSRCSCGEIIDFPTTPPQSPEANEDSIEPLLEAFVDLEPVQTERSAPFYVKPVPVASKHSDATLPPGAPRAAASPKVKRETLPYRNPKSEWLQRGSTAGTPYNRKQGFLIGSPSRDFYAPLILTLLGITLSVGAGVYVEMSRMVVPAIMFGDAVSAVLASTTVQIFFKAVTTVTVILVFHRFFDMDLGPPSGVVLKLAAMSTFPQGVAGLLLVHYGFCVEVGAAVLFIPLTVILFMWLFSIGIAEAFQCALAGCVLNIITWRVVG